MRFRSQSQRKAVMAKLRSSNNQGYVCQPVRNHNIFYPSQKTVSAKDKKYFVGGRGYKKGQFYFETDKPEKSSVLVGARKTKERYLGQNVYVDRKGRKYIKEPLSGKAVEVKSRENLKDNTETYKIYYIPKSQKETESGIKPSGKTVELSARNKEDALRKSKALMNKKGYRVGKDGDYTISGVSSY